MAYLCVNNQGYNLKQNLCFDQTVFIISVSYYMYLLFLFSHNMDPSLNSFNLTIKCYICRIGAICYLNVISVV